MVEIITRVEMETASAALDPALKTTLHVSTTKVALFKIDTNMLIRSITFQKRVSPKNKTNSKAADKLKTEDYRKNWNICKNQVAISHKALRSYQFD